MRFARMAVDNAAIPNGDPAVTYQATVTVEEDNEYRFLAPTATRGRTHS